MSNKNQKDQERNHKKKFSNTSNRKAGVTIASMAIGP